MSYHHGFGATASMGFNVSGSGLSTTYGTSFGSQTTGCTATSDGRACCDGHSGIDSFMSDPKTGSFAMRCKDGWSFGRKSFGQPVQSQAPGDVIVSAPPPPPPAAPLWTFTETKTGLDWSKIGLPAPAPPKTPIATYFPKAPQESVVVEYPPPEPQTDWVKIGGIAALVVAAGATGYYVWKKNKES